MRKQTNLALRAFFLGFNGGRFLRCSLLLPPFQGFKVLAASGYAPNPSRTYVHGSTLRVLLHPQGELVFIVSDEVIDVTPFVALLV